MGLSKKKSKSKTTNEPWAPAQPYILKNLQQQDAVFNASQPQLMEFAGQQRDTYGRLAPGAEAGIAGAQGLVNRTIAGDYLNGNPYLDAILDRTRHNTANEVGSRFSLAGRYGSGRHADILARAIADAENQARYSNYAQERQNQINAVGQAGNLMAGSQSLLNNAAELPWIGVQAANGAVRNASSGYGTSTTTQTQNTPWGQMLMGALGSGLQAYAMSDRRLKTRIEEIGLWDGKDGLKRYRYAYKIAPDVLVEGVMADEVRELRPAAYVPNWNGSGFDAVNYGAL
jgi:hypothetical protein